mmetsp:Transcript_23564/g.67878  ORF Transcript_23564/g.67878 Transcript_23564/m.67878 type:complete len:161 (-) Transcript_23564:655-1137(-)
MSSSLLPESAPPDEECAETEWSGEHEGDGMAPPSLPPEAEGEVDTAARQRRNCNAYKRKWRCLVSLAFLVVLGVVLGLLLGTQKGQMVLQGHPRCQAASSLLPERIGNGRCERVYNNAECGWDGNDCLRANEVMEKYPDCPVPLIWLFQVGDGVCDCVFD